MGMDMRYWIIILLLGIYVGLVGCQTTSTDDWLKAGQDIYGQVYGKPLSQQDIAAGLKQALEVGTTTVVTQIGKPNGFYRDAAIHIPLPEKFAKVQRSLNKVGLSSYLDELELSLNRAAEQATPKAKQLFWQAIRDMSWDDVMQIYNGPDDAATRYFQDKMTPALKREMAPVIQITLANAGAIKAYNKVMDKYYAIPYVPKIDVELEDYAMEKTLQGMFYYLAKEEAAIRHDPAKRTTALLQRVFGTKAEVFHGSIIHSITMQHPVPRWHLRAAEAQGG
jgi:hypothetical protein